MKTFHTAIILQMILINCGFNLCLSHFTHFIMLPNSGNFYLYQWKTKKEQELLVPLCSRPEAILLLCLSRQSYIYTTMT